VAQEKKKRRVPLFVTKILIDAGIEDQEKLREVEELIATFVQCAHQHGKYTERGGAWPLAVNFDPEDWGLDKAEVETLKARLEDLDLVQEIESARQAKNQN